MIKLLASDFDNTFRTRDTYEKNIEALQRWRAAGNIFCIVTGRFEPPENLPPMDAVLCCSGGRVCDIQGNVLNIAVSGENSKLIELARECMRHSDEDGEIKVCAENEIEYFDYKDVAGNDFERLKSMGRFYQVSIYFDDYAYTEKVCQEISAAVEGVNVLQNGTCVDIPPAGMNKAIGVKAYAESLGISEENIYTVGDAMNDIDMLKAFKGYVVEHGNEELKNIIGNTTKSVADLIDCLLLD